MRWFEPACGSQANKPSDTQTPVPFAKAAKGCGAYDSECELLGQSGVLGCGSAATLCRIRHRKGMNALRADAIGPHWDYTDSEGYEWRIMPDGTVTPK